jgi:hypothetical protein
MVAIKSEHNEPRTSAHGTLYRENKRHREDESFDTDICSNYLDFPHFESSVFVGVINIRNSKVICSTTIRPLIIPYPLKGIRPDFG